MITWQFIASPPIPASMFLVDFKHPKSTSTIAYLVPIACFSCQNLPLFSIDLHYALLKQKHLYSLYDIVTLNFYILANLFTVITAKTHWLFCV